MCLAAQIIVAGCAWTLATGTDGWALLAPAAVLVSAGLAAGHTTQQAVIALELVGIQLLWRRTRHDAAVLLLALPFLAT